MANKFLIAAGILSGWMMVILLYVNREDLPKQVFYTDPSSSSSPSDKERFRNMSRENPIPNDEELRKMSEKDLELLFHRYVSSTQATCSSVERMGKLTDGGWEVCLDPRYAPNPKNCLVYSFGINYEYSFDDNMEKYGCEVHSFDPSMTKTKDHLRGKTIHFHLEGIAGKDQPNPEKGKWKLFTVDSFRKRLGHKVGERRIDVLKMDVEGAERTSLPVALTDGSLSDIPQIAFEIHGQRNKALYLKNLPIFREAYARGLRIYHTNRNLGCPFTSAHTGVTRTECHEVYMVNITLAR